MKKTDFRAVIFLDADKTILGYGGSFIHDEKGKLSDDGFLLFELFDKLKIKPIIVSSRNRHQLFELSRFLGGVDFIGEMGYVIGFDAGQKIKTPFRLKKEENPFWLYRNSRLKQLVDVYSGYLELHTPWWKNLKTSLLLRGCLHYRNNLLLKEMNSFLTGAGFLFLRAVDNGATYPRTTLRCNEQRIYHLINTRVSKYTGVFYYLKKQKMLKSNVPILAAGDSASDLELAEISDHFFFMGSKKDFNTAMKLLMAQRFKKPIEQYKITSCSNRRELMEKIEAILREG